MIYRKSIYFYRKTIYLSFLSSNHSVQDDKITIVIVNVYTRLMAKTVMIENLGQMKKYYRIIELLGTIYGDEKAKKKLKSTDIKKDLQQKDKEIKDVEKTAACTNRYRAYSYHH
jgi:hypothetical protein